MRKLLLAAASMALIAGSAYAQGGSPYNSSGSQAGGPLGGQARAAEGAAMERGAMAPAPRPMMKQRTMKKKRMMKKRRSNM
ncbi:hypothetical protein Q8W71_20740 [Methylobacterium sp. NEAU 140]|uniref:hypothetical protein n=1 Tax=Methylobacterium sp. NEAU 140 TaxID=3064945 RepID=UPI0027335FC3|nr:hypothetical protein [Methylobacterium sp. NEAU 140]MDP4025060.1 hypothetical protein [Methylobacterium sp. NEAU 140]